MRPELTNWPPGTHKRTKREHHAAFLSASGGVRSGLNPSVFSDASCSARPDIVAGQVDMLPAERGQMGQQMIGDILGLAQGGDGALEIPRVPQDDRGDEQIEAGGAVLLVLVGAIADFAEPMNEDRPGQAVAGLALVEFLPGRAPQFGILDPVESEQRALQPPQLAQGGGDAILPRV